MKNKFSYVGIFGVSMGFALNRILVSIYGNSGRIVLASVILVLLLILLLYLIFSKLNVIVKGMSFIVAPLIVAMLGIILDNTLMGFGGFFLFLIAMVTLIIIAPKALEKQKEKQKEKIE